MATTWTGMLLMGLMGAMGVHGGLLRPLIQQPNWTDDQIATIEDAQESLDDAFIQALQPAMTGRSMPLLQPMTLRDVYFHDDKYQVTVSLSELTATSNMVFETDYINTDLAEQRADLRLVLPGILVRGAYTVDRKAWDDWDSEEMGQLGLQLNNVSAEGVAMLHVEGSTITVTDTQLDLRPDEVTFKVSRDLEDPDLWHYTNSEAFEDSVRHKVWRGLTHHLNMAVRDKLRAVLSRNPLGSLLKDELTQKSLQDAAAYNTESADQFVDSVMASLRNYIVDKYRDSVALPDIREKFERTVVFNVHGSFMATGGTVRGLSSLYRADHATLSADNDSIIHFYGSVGFEDMRLEYRHYEAEFMGLGPSGSVTTRMQPLRLHIHIHADFEADRIVLDRFKVEDVGDVEVSVTGLGFMLSWLASLIANWVVSVYQEDFVDLLEARYRDYVVTMLENCSLQKLMKGEVLR